MHCVKPLSNEIVNRFISQITNYKFFAAHETLEELWFERRFEKNARTRVLKGLINGAVSLELKKRSRPQASLKVWKYFLKTIYLVEEIDEKERDLFRKIIKNLQEVYKEYE